MSGADKEGDAYGITPETTRLGALKTLGEVSAPPGSRRRSAMPAC